MILHGDAWPWYLGALGEIEVGELLRELGPEWFVRHSVPIGAGTKDVDHLVIGPSGVFAINTKHHRDATVWVGDHTLLINGSKTWYLKVAESDARDVNRRLSSKVGFPVPVTPVIAVLNARPIVDKRSPHGRTVPVVNARSLISWLNARSASLSPTKIDLLKLAAEEPGTWHVDPRAADTFRIMQRFDRLVARVGTPQVSVASTPVPTTAPRPPKQRPARTGGIPWRSALPDIIRVWLAAAAIVVALLVVRGIANQPCDPTTTCILPGIYLAWKPLLMLLGVAVIGRAALSTVRSLRPKRRRRTR